MSRNVTIKISVILQFYNIFSENLEKWFFAILENNISDVIVQLIKIVK